jgi:hypothetical protein
MTAKPNPSSSPAKRSRTSTVSYPYHPIALCLDLAKGVREIGNGKQEVSRSLLASHLKIDENAADFSQKIASTKTYGLIDGRGTFKLTELSMGLFFPTADPEREKKIALLQAAAQPGAFAALLQRYDGSKPPSQELIGNVLSQQMGIPESWKMRVATFFIKSMEASGALGPDGFLRHAAELEKARQATTGGAAPTGTEPDRKVYNNGATAGGRTSGNVGNMTQDESEQLGVIVWKYPYKGKSLRVETPEDMSREVWEKLNRYITVLEPEK